MTDSMKFGPEWLRNMATDVTNNQVSGGGSSSTSSASSTNSNNNGSSSSYQFGHHVQQLPVRGLFPEFRYGREEMLSLFNKNSAVPEILPSFKKLFIDKVQYPLALTPSTEEEVFQSVPQQPTQRPQWLQRSPVAFNSAPRGNGRGGSVDRGRMRGKSMYHPIFPRPTPMFEDDARNLKSERSWSERNGGVAGESSTVIGVPDWSISPSSSPRKDFTGHPGRNLENWRRSRHDEDGLATSGPSGGGNPNSLSGGGVNIVSSGGPGADGWRGSGTNNFGNNRWGRSTSWRDDDSGNGCVESNAYNIPPMQRSYSTIATSERTYFSGLSKSSSSTSATGGTGVGIGGSGGDGTNKPTVNNRNYHSNAASHQWETEDVLPEWAMENPTDSGGTFDATGAFHGSVDEDDEKLRSGGSGSSSTTSSTSSSNRKSNNDMTKQQQDEINRRGNRKTTTKDNEMGQTEQDTVSLNDEDSETNDIESRPFKDENLQNNISVNESHLNHSTEKMAFSNKLENSDEHSSLETPSMSSSSPPQLAAQTTSTSTPNSANTSSLMQLSSQKMPLTELSDRMQEVADDMVEKLIMDDDNVSHDNQKSSAAEATNSVAHSASVVTGKLPPNNNQTSNRLVSNAAKVAALFKNQTLVNKPMFLPADSIMQQHHLQQVAGVPPPGTRMIPPPITKPNNELWYYRDPQSKIQGPFTAMEMNEWYRAGYFDENLYVRRVCDSRFAALGDLIKICGQMPFQSSHLIPPLQSTEVPSLTNPIPIMALQTHDPGHQMKEVPGVVLVNGPNMGAGVGDPKGSVTATADALIAAVKNTMCPSDISHMLNAHFQILQEQYIRHQEMMVVAEFSSKDTFNRLPPSEKAALVRQKVHMLGLPEHLTNLTSLSNSLATHNPAAGNQLYEVISEYSKKFSYGISPNEAQFHLQQHVHHQQQQQVQQQQVQQQSQNPFIDQDDYLQQQQQTNQQSGGMFQNVSYRSPFNQIEGNVSNASGEEQLNADMLNEMNLRMMLNQGRLRPGREQAQIPPQLGSAPNDFGAELIARGGPQVLAAAVNMMPQWPPHILPQIQHQPPQQLQPQQQQNTQPPQVVANQWPIIPGPVPVPQLHAALNKPPALMWPATDAGAAQMIMQQQQSLQLSQPQHVEVMHPKVENSFASVPIQQQQSPQPQAQHRHQDSNSNNVGNTKDELSVEENANAINNNVSNTVTGNMPAPSGVALGPTTYANNANTKNKNEKLKHNEDNQNSVHITTKQQAIATSVNTINSSNTNNNKRNGKQKSNEKPIDSMSKNKQQSQQQAVPVAGPTEEERRKEAAEDKRKQKEEKKRQQMEDEKKRLQLVEEEKRRQASEEKERQKEIHAHRRKAMLASNSGGSSTGLGSNSNLAANGKSTTSGPGSSAMTKQERMQISVAPWSTNAQATIASAPGPSLAEIQKAERKERRADQQRHMELMEKQMRIAAAAEASDNVLKWNAAPVAVKSLAEIQAEEAKRLASEQAANAELQRRKEQDQVTSAAANNLSPSNPFALIWSGSKVWGASNNTSGFWEEPVKFSTAVASISAPTSASVIAKTVAQAPLGSNAFTTSKQSATTSSVYGGNTLSSSATTGAGGANRNLNKSQTVSNMSSSNWTSVTTSNNISQAKSYQQNSSAAKQQGNKDKKGNKNIAGSSSSTNCSSSNTAVPTVSVATNHINKNDDYRNEYTGWCTRSLNNMNPKVDVPTFVTFLQDLESPYEVKDYIRMYLGESKEYTEFAKQFLERRSKYRNLQRAQNAHIDDMCKPAPAINPSGNDSFDNKGKQKKVKKSKMTKLDARILGFSVTAAEGRINVGDRDYVDAS